MHHINIALIIESASQDKQLSNLKYNNHKIQLRDKLNRRYPRQQQKRQEHMEKTK